MRANKPGSVRSRTAAALLSGMLVVPVQAGAELPSSWTRWPARAYDLLLVRPVGTAGFLAGAGFFALAYPLALPFGDPEVVREAFLDEPFHYAFRRPLGDFEDE